MSAAPPPGIYVPSPTFFLPSSGTATPPLDVPSQIAHSLHLVRNGVRGLVLLGSTGEAVHLSRAERTRLLRGVRTALDEAGFAASTHPLVAGTAANSTDETVEMLAEAKEAGAAFGLVLAPGYFAGGLSQAGVKGWFEDVASRAAVPVMVYHYPGVSNNLAIHPTTMVALSKHPNIVGCKLSHTDVSTHARVALSPDLDPNFSVFTGLGAQLVPVMSVGCVGAIDGLAGIFPASVVRLYELAARSSSFSPSSSSSSSSVVNGATNGHGKNGVANGSSNGVANGAAKEEEGEIAELRRLQYEVSTGEEMVIAGGVPAVKEAVRRVLGIGSAAARWPFVADTQKAGWRWEAAVGRMASVEEKAVVARQR